MSLQVETLEDRRHLSAADVLDRDNGSVLDRSTPSSLAGTVVATPMAVAAVPPVGGTYRGALTRAYFEGNRYPGVNGTLTNFTATTFTIALGKRRTYGTFTFSKYIVVGLTSENLADIPLSGRRMAGPAFKLYGSDDNWSAAPGSVDVVVSGTVSPDGRTIAGAFATTYHTMAGPQYDLQWSGQFAVRRVRGG